ncbi:histone-lysine N-methyltransferase PRDM9-like, partial [Clarias magur]
SVIMSTKGETQLFFRTSQVPDPPVSQDVKMETSDGGTPEVTEVCVKKEEDIYDYEDNLDNTPEDICIKEEDPDHKDYLYCDICKSVFFNKCEVHGPPLFIPDTPVPLGVSDRARLTLPPGLEIQKSGIPDAGLGVFNKGETVPVGAHFGPYQGELVDREEAMNSGYSWVIYRRRQCEEYIDGAIEVHANWMRYVNCARNEEQNLVAFQYRGEILYRCCRPINPGQELLVWYEEEYAKDLSPAFDYLWNKKSSTNDCEVCKSVFFNKCEVHGPPLFIPDTPVPLGVSDRARLTLPPGLEIQKSGIPDAGLGVFNKGETVPVGAHFGPYQGELVDREEAMNSGYSWVIYRSRQCEEYIDGRREVHANWMRYVNCARNDAEQNLVAFQYRGGILYRCCRPINPGQELLVWYEEEYAKDLSPAFDYLWNKKSSTNERKTQHFFVRSQAPPLSQMCEDARAETSDGGTAEVFEVRVKKERLELDISDHEDDLDNTPEVISIKVEDPEHNDYLYCEICKSVFFNKCEVHGPPLFIPDTPVPLGVSDRAKQTLPLGLEIQKSSIPDAGLGVFNKAETVPVGAHFGPYQGELVTTEEAMNSGYSWVIYRSRECEEYVDATSEMTANWMRYVNCARNDEEQNLVAFQYRGGILYRCCRPINPGQELLVWYEEEYAKDLSPAFDYLWNKKSSTN